MEYRNFEETLPELIEKINNESDRLNAMTKMFSEGLPKMKTTFCLATVVIPLGIVYFYSEKSLADNLKYFGDIEYAAHKNQWKLIVDPRFDFSEVVLFLKNMEVIYRGS
jgi:hypothetical protein